MRSCRVQPFGDAEAERELLVVPRRPHRHRDRVAADADLERLLDRDLIALASPLGQPDDVDRRCGVRRSLHDDRAYASGSPDIVMSASAAERFETR